ncbi:AAA ATPase, partial [Halocaridina rubra]
FHDVYTRICRKRSIPVMDQSEFVSLCTLLESRGMLQLKRSKEIRNCKVLLRLNPEEAEQVLGDRNLLAAVLEDKESLGKLCKA